MQSKGLCFFHAFTGCDVVSAFHGKGKKSDWHTWNVCLDATGVFIKLSQYPTVLNDKDERILETFVTTLCDRSSDSTRVNAARLELVARKQRQYEAIPPTQAVLMQHTKRAIYQASWYMGPGNSMPNGSLKSC